MRHQPKPKAKNPLETKAEAIQKAREWVFQTYAPFNLIASEEERKQRHEAFGLLVDFLTDVIPN